jgi:hypothetical protein
MRASIAYFVGAGTIVAAIAIGVGGGLIAGNIMHPVTPKQGPDTAKYERRAEPVLADTAANTPERVPYLTGSQAFGAMVAPPAQAEPQTRTASTEPPAPAQAANDAKPNDAKPNDVKANDAKTANAAATAAAAPAAKPVEQQTAREPSPAPDNAYAKASDSDMKRAAQDRRRAERRQHWAERRRQDFREPRDRGDWRERTDWNDVARNVREDSQRDFIASRRPALPQIRLFGADDDD